MKLTFLHRNLIYLRRNTCFLILSRHTEFCKADRTTWKINVARHQYDTERTKNRAGSQPQTAVSPFLGLVSTAQQTERLCRKIPAHSVLKPCHELKHSQNHAMSHVTERARSPSVTFMSYQENLEWTKPTLGTWAKPECAGILRQSLSVRCAIMTSPKTGGNNCLRLRPPLFLQS